jgi:transcriptional regulator with XRE-family HTH domain
MPSARKSSAGPGERIAAIRSARRMTQSDLARAANVSLSMIRKLEQGSRNPSDNVLDAIAASLSVDPSSQVGSVGQELADVLIYVAAIANRAGIDLADELRAKERINETCVWTAPVNS